MRVGVVWTFFSLVYHFSFLSPSLWETARYRLKYCLKGPLSPKQPTNQSRGLYTPTEYIDQEKTDPGFVTQAEWRQNSSGMVAQMTNSKKHAQTLSLSLPPVFITFTSMPVKGVIVDYTSVVNSR